MNKVTFLKQEFQTIINKSSFTVKIDFGGQSVSIKDNKDPEKAWLNFNYYYDEYDESTIEKVIAETRQNAENMVKLLKYIRGLTDKYHFQNKPSVKGREVNPFEAKKEDTSNG